MAPNHSIICIRLFASSYANGGGPCYIVSVGPYKINVGDALVATDFFNAGTGVGLEAVAKEDEPTLIVFPEGQNMVETVIIHCLDRRLDQCGNLQDRFCIMDVFDTGETLVTSSDVSNAIG